LAIQALLITATEHGVFLLKCFSNQGIIQAWETEYFHSL
jgi:hypothetical protein